MKIIKLIILSVILLPLMLIVNESNSLIPNFCGLAYLCVLCLLGKTKAGARFWDWIEP